MSLLRSRKHLTAIPQKKSLYPMAKNEVMCLPHQITSKEIFYNWSKLTMIHFLRLVEAPVKHRASQSFNKINVLLAGGEGSDCWKGYLRVWTLLHYFMCPKKYQKLLWGHNRMLILKDIFSKLDRIMEWAWTLGKERSGLDTYLGYYFCDLRQILSFQSASALHSVTQRTESLREGWSEG